METCGICFEDLHEKRRNLRQLWCSHIFHEMCIVKSVLMTGQTACPICRSTLEPKDFRPQRVIRSSGISKRVPMDATGLNISRDGRTARDILRDLVLDELNDPFHFTAVELNHNFLHQCTLAIYTRKLDGIDSLMYIICTQTKRGKKFFDFGSGFATGVYIGPKDARMVWDIRADEQAYSAVKEFVERSETMEYYDVYFHWIPLNAKERAGELYVRNRIDGESIPPRKKQRGSWYSHVTPAASDAFYYCRICSAPFLAICARWFPCGHRCHEDCYRLRVLERGVAPECELCAPPESLRDDNLPHLESLVNSDNPVAYETLDSTEIRLREAGGVNLEILLARLRGARFALRDIVAYFLGGTGIEYIYRMLGYNPSLAYRKSLTLYRDSLHVITVAIMQDVDNKLVMYISTPAGTRRYAEGENPDIPLSSLGGASDYSLCVGCSQIGRETDPMAWSMLQVYGPCVRPGP